MANPDSPFSKTELAKGVTSPDANTRLQTFAGILRDMSAGKRDPMLSDPVLARSVSAEIVKAADANYKPGKFTTFAGFEWTSNPKQRNLHRVVVFRDTGKLPDMVLSALDLNINGGARAEAPAGWNDSNQVPVPTGKTRPRPDRSSVAELGHPLL